MSRKMYRGGVVNIFDFDFFFLSPLEDICWSKSKNQQYIRGRERQSVTWPTNFNM